MKSKIGEEGFKGGLVHGIREGKKNEVVFRGCPTFYINMGKILPPPDVQNILSDIGPFDVR